VPIWAGARARRASRSYTGWMLIRSVDDVIGTDRDVHGGGWKSRRVFLSDDELGYSVHETTVAAGTQLRFTYRHHRETVYCVQGEGSIEDVATGHVVPLAPGGMYSAGVGDEHVLTCNTETKFLCIFTPPLIGTEEAN